MTKKTLYFWGLLFFLSLAGFSARAQFSEDKNSEATQQSENWRQVAAVNTKTASYEYCAAENDFLLMTPLISGESIASSPENAEKITFAVATRPDKQGDQTNIAINFSQNRLQQQSYHLVLWIDAETRYVLEGKATNQNMLIISLPEAMRRDILTSLYHAKTISLQGDFLKEHVIRFSMKATDQISEALAKCRQKNVLPAANPLKDLLHNAGIEELQQLQGQNDNDFGQAIEIQYVWNRPQNFGTATWNSADYSLSNRKQFQSLIKNYLVNTKKNCSGVASDPISSSKKGANIIQTSQFLYAHTEMSCKSRSGSNTAVVLFIYHPLGFGVVFQDSDNQQRETIARSLRQKIIAVMN